MNYFSILILVALGFAVIEMLFDRHTKAQNQIFTLSFISVSFLVCIKYYFGPDISQYVEYYETLAPIKDIINGSYENKWNFEFGYNLFSAFLNHLNISYWGMTCIISILYLTPIYILFKQIDNYKCLALLALVVFDYNLLLCQLRQCLATSMVLFACIAYQKKHTNICLLLILSSTFFHKSAIFALSILAIIILLSHTKIDLRAYILLAIAFFVFLIFPLENIITSTLEKFNFVPYHVIHSIRHHFSKSEILQAIMPVYLAAIFIIAYYSDFNQKDSKWHWLTWGCVAIIVILFQYYFFLNRLRSFFIPFVIIYTITICLKSSKNDKIPRQLFTIIFITYSLFHAHSLQVQTNSMQSKINYPSTILQLSKTSHDEIRKKQLEEASVFWEEDYKNKKNEND